MPDNQYLNIQISNSSLNNDPSHGSYIVNKTQPILDKCSDYYASIIRFSIPLDGVPLYIIPIEPFQVNPNKTTFIVGISFGGVNFPTTVIYVPLNPSPPPVQNVPDKQVITDYYFMFAYQDLVTLVNTALAASYAAFQLAFPAAPQAVANITPFYTYDSINEIISLVVHRSWATTGVNQALVYQNEPLTSFFDAFPFNFFTNNDPQGKDFAIVVLDNGSNGYALFGTAPTNPPTFLKISQEFSVLSTWGALKKIIVATAMPIVSEYIPSFNPSGATQNGEAISFPIFLDFLPAFEFAGQSRSVAVYNPTSQYRLVDMISDNVLQKVDIKLYWTDEIGNLYPLLITKHQTADFKIGFFNKKLYKNC